MKNQYFGDIYDFKKYVILKWFIEGLDEKLLIAWYLTKDDKNKKDGNKIEHLNDKNLIKCEDKLFKFLKQYHYKKNINILEQNGNLIAKNVEFFNENLENYRREEWFNLLKIKSKECDIVFVDPDNGIKFNNEKSNKHIRLCEIKELWKMNKSLIIYQHFLMVDHKVFMGGLIWRLFEELRSIEKPFVSIVYSKNVVNIFILKQKYKKQFDYLKNKIFNCNGERSFLNVFKFDSDMLKE